jgi:hypothetical protein
MLNKNKQSNQEEKHRIHYTKPQVVDLGPLEGLIGGENCDPTGNSATAICTEYGGAAEATCGLYGGGL